MPDPANPIFKASFTLNLDPAICTGRGPERLVEKFVSTSESTVSFLSAAHHCHDVPFCNHPTKRIAGHAVQRRR